MLSFMPAQKKPASPFGERLIALRKIRRITQTELADAIGTTQRVISYYEAVAPVPSGDIVLNLAKALGVSTDELLGAKPPRKIDSPIDKPEARRYWRRFQQLMELPEKDQRAVLRTIDSMTKANQTTKTPRAS